MTAAFDSAATGTSSQGTGDNSGSIVTHEGDCVILVANTYFTTTGAAPTNVTCGETAMTELVFAGINNAAAPGGLYVYALQDCPAGTLALAADDTGGLSEGWDFAAVAYSGVGSISSTYQTAYGSSSGSPSMAVTAPPSGGIVVQSFGLGGETGITAVSGGTLRVAQATSYEYAPISISDTTEAVTLTATVGEKHSWAGVAITLEPNSGTTVSPGSATVGVVGGTAAIEHSTTVTPGTASVTVSEGTPGVTIATPGVLSPGGAVISMTEGTPGVTTDDSTVVTPGSASIGVTGGTPIVAMGPLGAALEKLANHESIVIVGLGDSTLYAAFDQVPIMAGGYIGRMATILGKAFNATATINFYGNGTSGTVTAGTDEAPTYETPVSDFGYCATPITLYTASGESPPTISVYNGGIPGSTLDFQETYLENGVIPSDITPDFILIASGINEDLDGWVGSRYETAITLLLTNLKSGWPGVPLLYITENPLAGLDSGASLGHVNDMTALLLNGEVTPLTPPLQASTTQGVWVLDTWPPFENAGVPVADLLGDGEVHPNPEGNALQANWMIEYLAPSIPYFQPDAATTTLTAGTPNVDIASSTTIQPGSATITTTPGTPGVTAPRVETPSGTSVTLTPGTPGVEHPTTLTPGSTSVTVTPGTPGVTAPQDLTPSTGNVSISGGTADVAALQNIVPPTSAEIHVSGGTAQVEQSELPVIVEPTTATATVSGGSPTVDAPTEVTPTSADVTVTEGSPEVTTVATPVVLAPGTDTVTVSPGTPAMQSPTATPPPPSPNIDFVQTFYRHGRNYIKLVEDYSVAHLRNDVRDAMQMAGEVSILLQLYHPGETGLVPCPLCGDDVYKSPDPDCTLCYGTTFLGGVKAAMKVWSLYTDRDVSEELGPRGVYRPDHRSVTFEAFPMVTEHDILVRVQSWNANGTPAVVEGYYMLQKLQRRSLRTGNRFGQASWDVVSQKAQLSELALSSHGITEYPIVNQTFMESVQFIPGTVLTQQEVLVTPDVRTFLFPFETAPAGVDSSAQTPTEEAYVFTQNYSASVWTIQHNLGYEPSVTIFINNEEVDADVTFPDLNSAVITFSTPQVGTARLT